MKFHFGREKTGPMPEQSRVEKFFERSDATIITSLLLSSALHIGIYSHKEVEKVADDIADTAFDFAQEKERQFRVAYEQLTGDREAADKVLVDVQEMVDDPEKLKNLDLSDFYFDVEMVIAGFTPEERDNAKRNYDIVITQAKELRLQGASDERVWNFLLRQQGHYQEDQKFLTEMFADDQDEREADCDGRMKYIVSAAQDVFPELDQEGKISVQRFGSYIDEQGGWHDGHVRALIDQGDTLLVLEEDKVKTKKKKLDDALYYEAKWLAATSLLARKDLYDFGDSAVDEPETVSFRQDIFSYPASSAQYKEDTGLGDITLQTIEQEQKVFQEEQLRKIDISFLAPISDKELQDNIAKRTQQEAEEREKTEKIFKESLAARGITYGLHESFTGYKKIILDISQSPSKEPLTYEDVQKLHTLYSTEAGFQIYLSTSQDLSAPVRKMIRGNETFDRPLPVFFSSMKEPYSELFLHEKKIAFVDTVGTYDFAHVNALRTSFISPLKDSITLNYFYNGQYIDDLCGIPTHTLYVQPDVWSDRNVSVIIGKNALRNATYESVVLDDIVPDASGMLEIDHVTKMKIRGRAPLVLRGGGQRVQKMVYYAPYRETEARLHTPFFENFSFFERLEMQSRLYEGSLRGVRVDELIVSSTRMGPRVFAGVEAESVVFENDVESESRARILFDPNMFIGASVKEINFTILIDEDAPERAIFRNADREMGRRFAQEVFDTRLRFIHFPESTEYIILKLEGANFSMRFEVER